MNLKSMLAALAITSLLLSTTSPLRAGLPGTERVGDHPVAVSTQTGLRLAQVDPSPSINQKRASQRRLKKRPKPAQRVQELGDEPISTRAAKSRQAKQKVITTVAQMGEIEHKVKQYKVLRGRIKALKAKAKKGLLNTEERAQLQEAENKVKSFENDMDQLVGELERLRDEVDFNLDVDPDHPLLHQAILTEDNHFMSDQKDKPHCGQHSCRMVLRALGKRVSAKTLIRQSREDGIDIDQGITTDDIKELFRKNGVDAAVADYKALGSHNAVQALKRTLKATKEPLIVLVQPNQQFRDLIAAGDDSSMPASVQRAADIAKERAEYSHFVVVEGIVSMGMERGWQEHFVIRDPQNMTYTHPVSGFELSFTGEVVYPTKSLSSTAGGTSATP